MMWLLLLLLFTCSSNILFARKKKKQIPNDIYTFMTLNIGSELPPALETKRNYAHASNRPFKMA